jgi:hypothetical protein
MAFTHTIKIKSLGHFLRPGSGSGPRRPDPDPIKKVRIRIRNTDCRVRAQAPFKFLPGSGPIWSDPDV